MEEMQQASNGTESQAFTIPTTLTASHITQIAQQMSLGGSPVTVVQLPGGQFQLQAGVIQSAQSSVIQSPQVQSAVQSQGSDSDDSQDSTDSGSAAQKTREILARRPSYRKILNELSGEEVTSNSEGNDGNPTSTVTMTMPTTTQIYQTSSGQYITIAPNGTIQLANPGGEGIQGLQALAMTNSAATQQGPTILQYAQTSDGQQILVPSNQVVVQGAGGEMQTYQIRTSTASSMPQTVVMTSPVGLSQGKSDDPTMKREIRLAKNREAARGCRRKKKDYVKCLENRVAVLENQNRTLIEELKTEAARDCRLKKKDYIKCLENRVGVLENQNKTLIEELKTLKDLYCVKTG